LGVREPHIYATTTFAQIAESCAHHAAGFGLDRTFRQSNQTGVICGLEPYGYVAAMHALAQMEKKSCSEPIRNPPDEIGFLLVIALACPFRGATRRGIKVADARLVMRSRQSPN
jgi:hypothetical protein